MAGRAFSCPAANTELHTHDGSADPARPVEADIDTRKILLIEPSYPNKYPPLGLMKIAAYHGPSGRNDTVRFVKGPNPRAMSQTWDRAYVTTLFSFEWQRTAKAIDFAIRATGHPGRVFVGGIAASLMHDQFRAQPQWSNVRFIKGLLQDAPAAALQLDQQDFGHDDTAGTPIDDLPPDYSIIDQITYRYPVRDAYFAYATRGCIRSCSFCGVPALEGQLRAANSITETIKAVTARHGEQRDLILMDNNVAASPTLPEIIAEILDLGFHKGAKISRTGGRTAARRLDFNQGLDARILCRAPSFMREVARTCIDPLRIAFDHLGLRRQYERAITMAADHGITSLSNYMLYNFHDTPEDLYARMEINIRLNQRLGLRIWSFPMRYQPVTLPDRSHVGPNWSRHRLRSLQLMLQRTHGVVGAQPSYFSYIYGDTAQEFIDNLDLPHAYLFHRQHYSTGPGWAQREEYENILHAMTAAQRQELDTILSGPATGRRPNERALAHLADDASIDPPVRLALRHHAIDHRLTPSTLPAPPLPPDQAVEDAGLWNDENGP